MRIGRALALVGLAAAASLALTIVAVGQGPDPDPPAVGSVVWTERPGSLAELEAASQSVVEAEVAGIADGPPLEAGDPHEEIPTQRISFETISVLDGPSPGERFQLFKTGSEDFHLADDPPYEPGERYVLFIRPRNGEPGTYLPAAPDGRVLLEAGDKAHVAIRGPVKRELENRSRAQIEAEVAR